MTDIDGFISALKTIYGNSDNGVALVSADLKVIWCNNIPIDILNCLEVGLKIDEALPCIHWYQAKPMIVMGKPVQLITNSARKKYNVLVQPFMNNDKVEYAIVHFTQQYHSGDLATNVIIHDLKNPIKGILMALGDREGRDANAIRKYANKALNLIADITSISDQAGTSTNRPENYNITDFTRTYFNQCADILGKTVNVTVSVTDKMMICRFDPHNLDRALANLVLNAKKHCSSYIKLTLRNDGDEAVFEIENDGESVPENIRDRVFEPCVKSSASQGGGLGLYTAKHIVESIGGTISFDDSDKTVFTVRLPLAGANKVSSSCEVPDIDREHLEYMLGG